MAEQQRVALITGAASGIGRAAALAFAATGVRVVVADIDAAGGGETVELVQAAGGTGRFFPVDVTDAEAVQALIEDAVGAFGRVDYAINNAGIEGAWARTAEYPPEMWQRVLDINLTGVWHCMRAEIPQMLAQGGGVIVNVASVAGLIALPRGSAYAAAKHAVIGLTKSAAVEYARQHIRINAVCPGFTSTPMVERLTATVPALAGRLEAGAPLGRLSTPEEIAAAMLFLCSDGAASMAGHALVLDGGTTAQ